MPYQLACPFKMLVASIVVSLCGGTSRAGIVYQSQSRSISANANETGAPSASQYVAAPDFLIFDRQITALAGGYGNGRGQQTSTLTASGISATGYWVGSGHVLPPSANGGGQSSLSVVFLVDEPTPFVLTTQGLTEFQSTFAFRSISGGALNLTVAPASLTGVLGAGTYTISANIAGSGSNGVATFGQFSLQLQLQTPTPGAAALLVPAAALIAPRRRRVS